jgi:hypothetical protein
MAREEIVGSNRCGRQHQLKQDGESMDVVNKRRFLGWGHKKAIKAVCCTPVPCRVMDLERKISAEQPVILYRATPVRSLANSTASAPERVRWRSCDPGMDPVVGRIG